MLAIMEKYATNLEAVVDERTLQLKEEKKRSEELLHSMLPRYNALLHFSMNEILFLCVTSREL